VTGSAEAAPAVRDIKSPHAVADDHGDPETLLADLARAEQACGIS
jgi:hypothetical protein